MEYGNSKGIIEEGAAPNMTVPEGGKSYEKMLAHSAADKIFEMKVNARKSKKEKRSSITVYFVRIVYIWQAMFVHAIFDLFANQQIYISQIFK